MQTQFSPEALADPHTRELEGILRSCVHCGFCTATCPTYVTARRRARQPARAHLPHQGPARDRPQDRGRGRLADRPLPLLPLLRDDLPVGRRLSPARRPRAGQDRAELPPPARRPPHARGARPAHPFASGLPRGAQARGARTAIHARAQRSAGDRAEARGDAGACPDVAAPAGPAEKPGVYAAAGVEGKRRRMALLGGCAEAVLRAPHHAATIRLLNRAGIEVVIPNGEGCCGSLAHHMGAEQRALAQARADIDAWTREIDGGGARGDRRHRLRLRRDDQGLWLHAARRSGLRREGRAGRCARQGHRGGRGRARTRLQAPRDASPSPIMPPARCSTAQKIVEQPKALLRRAGFDVRAIPEAHLCCGSAGTYNILQPEIAGALRDRKVANIARVKPDVDRRRQHRLPDPDRLGDRDAGRAYCRTARLGERRPGAGRLGLTLCRHSRGPPGQARGLARHGPGSTGAVGQAAGERAGFWLLWRYLLVDRFAVRSSNPCRHGRACPAIHAGPPQERVPPRRDRQEGGRSQGFSRLPASMRWAFVDGRDKPGHDALMAPSATSAMLPIPSPQQPTR